MKSSFAVVLLTTGLLAGHACAGTTVFARIEGPGFAQSDYLTEVSLPPGETLVELQMHETSGFSSAGILAEASDGIVKAYAATRSFNSTIGARTYASATAISTFSATFTDPGLAGTAGRMTVSFDYFKTSNRSVSPYAPADEEVTSVSTSVFESIFGARTARGLSYSDHSDWISEDNRGNVREDLWQETVDSTGSSTRVTPGHQELTIDFVWGETIRFELGITAACTSVETGEYEGFSSCEVDAAHSGYWGGISSVTSDGVAVSDYTIRTDAGFDLRTSLVPVPEPAAWQLLALGGALLIGAQLARTRARRGRAVLA